MKRKAVEAVLLTGAGWEKGEGGRTGLRPGWAAATAAATAAVGSHLMNTTVT